MGASLVVAFWSARMALLARLGIALVAGVATGLAYPPYGWWLLLLPGLVGLLGVLQDQTARRGAVLGFAFGIGYFGVMLPWLQVIGVDAWIALTLLESVFVAGFGAAAALVRPYRWWPLATAGLWVGVELARSEVPFTGFPWGRIGFALAGTPMESYVRYLGVPALGALVVLGAAAVWWGLTRRAGTVAALGGFVLVVGGLPIFGVVLPVGPAGATEPLRVAAVQGGVPGTGADGLGEQREVVANHVRATEAFAADVRAGRTEPADVVLWPENSTDVDPFTDPEAYAAIDGAVQTVGVPVLVGAITAGSAPDLRRNVGLVWSPNSGAGDGYVKRHLVPFGEYIPLRDVLAPVISRLDEIPRDFEAGDEPGVLDLGPVVVGDSLCYDIAFDRAVAPAVREGAELLVVQTNNATYRDTGQPDQQWAISRLRAIETGRDLVVASTNGISGVVTADGRVLARSTTDGAVVITETVQLADGLTPAVRFGAWWERGLVAIGLVGVAVAVGARVRRRATPERPATGGSAPDAPNEPRQPVGSGTSGRAR